MNLPAILNALQEEGYSEEYTYLSERIDEKVQLLFKAQYPFASEMSIDTTGFESCYTLAKMKGLTDIVEKTTKASLACRGMQPLWSSGVL